VRLLHPAVFSPPEHVYRAMGVVTTPPPVNHQPQPSPLKPAFVARLDAPSNALRLPAPQPKVLRMEDNSAPAVNISLKTPAPLPVKIEPVMPKRGVTTNVFSTGSSATPTIAARPASQVQTGGFGDPNGIPAKGSPGKAVNVAGLGSFDLPSGPGSGNGSGGAKGVAGVIASAGFGSGTATADNHPRSIAIQSSGFGSTLATAPPKSAPAPAEISKVLPAEILSKPTPVYTQEARNLRIEGEVLLEVVLESSGNLRVLRVVRGLGHGLDDNAVRAAEQIRFKPATKNGQPSDSTVVLHIVFQLA